LESADYRLGETNPNRNPNLDLDPNPKTYRLAGGASGRGRAVV
jgi:hypothetical protein